MKQLKNIFTVFFALTIFVSCSGDDSPGDDSSAGGDHTYSISITVNNILSGTSLSGSLPNEDYAGMYFNYEGTTTLSLGLGTGTSDFILGGAVVLTNGQMTSPLSDEYDADSGSSTLIVTFKKDGASYTFVSTSGSCTVSNMQTYGVSAGIGGASFKLNFSGTFRQENFDGPDEDKPLVQMSGNIDIKKLVTD